MKIGIITLSGGENYGCHLQMYAVLKTYEELGYTPMLIPDNTNNGIKFSYQERSRLSKLTPAYIAAVLRVRTKRKYLIKNQRDRLIPSVVRKKRNAALYAKSKNLRSENFNEFQNSYIKQTDFTINKDNIPNDKLAEFDFFSVGSDQVWNPTYPQVSEVKFLTFAKNNQKLTFAPSFGISELPEFVKKSYSEWLKEIPMISVREEQGAKLIKELTGKEATVICDPTMTVKREVWKNLEKKPNFTTDKPFAVTYFLGNESNKYRRYIYNIAKQKGLQVINLFDIREPDYYTAGPAEFIYLIHHADAVFTDSFHAAVFSIIFQKDFVVFERIEDGRSMGSRLKTLLDKFSLSDRMYSVISKIEFTSPNFSNTEKLLEKERLNAIEFLKKSIEYNLNN